MKNITKILLLIILTTSCNTTNNKNDTKNDKTDKPEQKETIMNDTTPKVTGVGGIFFRSKNTKETREWSNNQITN
jgi:hypothetical protein